MAEAAVDEGDIVDELVHVLAVGVGFYKSAPVVESS